MTLTARQIGGGPSELTRLQRENEQLRSVIRTCLCPGGGWNGMPKDMVATVADCLAADVCGCDLGDALKKQSDYAIAAKAYMDEANRLAK